MQKSILALKLLRLGIGMKLREFFRLKTSKKIFGNWYNVITRFSRLMFEDFRCMNYGYADQEPPALLPEDETERYPLQLYHLAATGGGRVNLEGLEVLEVGSGRGGGASYVARYLKPRQITGLDLSPTATADCREKHGEIPNLEFVTGDAEALPFPAGRFDAVLNVESSHCYPHFALFLAQVWRVLRPGGHFLIADLRDADKVAAFEEAITARGFRVRLRRDISPQVVRALTLDTARRLELINRNKLPWIVKWPLTNFAGCADSITYNAYARGRKKYLFLVLQKPEAPAGSGGQA